MVVLWHSVLAFEPTSKLLSPFFTVGTLWWSGVDLFFVLSGFLIGGILLDARNSPRYFRTFYARRAYRILPLYFSVLAAAYLLRSSPIIPWAAYPVFLQNFWMAHLGSFGSSEGLAPTWSLAIEEQFYLTIPLAVRLLRRSHVVALLLLVVALAPLLRTAIMINFNHGNFADYVLMPCRADALCLGVLAAVLVRDAASWNFVISNKVMLYAPAVILLCGMGWLSYQRYSPYSKPMVTGGYSLLAMFYTCVLLIAVRGGRAARLLSNPLLMKLGGVAYCTYLVHVPLIAEGRRLLPLMAEGAGFRFAHSVRIFGLIGAICGILMSFLIASFSWRFLERPILRRGHKYEYSVH